MRVLLPAERGDRTFFGKIYHWHLSPTGVLFLAKGKGVDCGAEVKR